MQESRALQYILGASLLMIAVFAVSSFVMINSQADSSTATVSITPVSPTVTSVFVSSTADGGNDALNAAASFTLTAGTTTTVHVNGVVADNNGDADISTVAVHLYRQNATGGNACSSDANDCYVNATCPITAGYGTALQASYTCSFALEYYADSTSAGGAYPAETWKVSVIVTDLSAAATEHNSATKEMPTMGGLTIPGTISFGTLALGTTLTDTTNVTQTITQQGNDVQDVEVSMAGTTLACLTSAVSTGSIARASISWAITDVVYASATPITGSVVDTNLAVGYRTGAVVAPDLYWYIVIPSSGVGGTCTGTVTISALPAV